MNLLSLNLPRIGLLTLSCVLALGFGHAIFSPLRATLLFLHTSYWWITAGALLWGWAGWRVWRGAWSESAWTRDRRLWCMALGLALVAAIVCMHSPIQFKVVNDEPVQLLTADSLYKRQEAALALRGYDIGAGFDVTDGKVDKRPILYAWLTAQVHNFTGHRFENGFYLNRALGVITILWLLVAGRRMLGDVGGALLALLCLLPPLFGTLANAGGFEMLNFLLIVVLWHASILVLERPDDPARLGWLAMTAALLIHCRYESVLFILPAALAVLLAWWRAGSITIPWVMMVAPLMAIPRLWQQKVFEQGDTWQLNSKPEAMGQPFGFQFFYDNVGHALNYFFSLEPVSMNAVLLSGAGLLAVGFWVLMIYKEQPNHQSDASRLGTYLTWLGLSGYFLLMMLYFWGQFDDRATQRLAFPVHLWLGLPLVAVLALHRWGRRLVPVGIVVVVVLLFSRTVPQLERDLFTATNSSTITQNWIVDYARTNPIENRLVIDRFGGLAWLLFGNSAIPQENILNFPERIRYHWRHRTFSEILVLQRLRYHPQSEQWVAFPDDMVGPDFKLEEVVVKRFSPVYGVRLMRVTDISPSSGWRPGDTEKTLTLEAIGAEAPYRVKWREMLP
ncbi:MAG: glycosyltransferase family 39 protein [Verrucomicrobiota bacterium]